MMNIGSNGDLINYAARASPMPSFSLDGKEILDGAKDVLSYSCCAMMRRGGNSNTESEAWGRRVGRRAHLLLPRSSTSSFLMFRSS
eukprot:scaffold657451_cov32-Prasinocladus_malaysianus.AAC.1